MRIVVPVSRFDTHLLQGWINVVQHLKCGYQHQLHFVLPQSIREYADKAKEELAAFFDTVTIHALQVEPQGGWPVGPNAQFYACAQIMGNEPRNPWFFCELDCKPIRANAFDALAARYVNAGVPFFGSVGPTPHRDNNTGKIVNSPEGPSDVMVSGVAIYPGDMANRQNIKPLMDDFMKGPDSANAPWDIYLRYAMRSYGIAHTDLIGNCWNTVNYRIEGGQIACDPNSSHEVYAQNPTWEPRKGNNKVHPEAVVIHGCKDDSLDQLILNDQIPEVIFSRPQAKALAPVENEEIKALKDQNAALAEQMKQMMAMMQNVMKPVQQELPPVVNLQPIQPIQPLPINVEIPAWENVEKTEKETKSYDPVPSEEALVAFFHKAGKPLVPRVAALQFNCSSKELLSVAKSIPRLQVSEKLPFLIGLAQSS